MFTTLRNHFFPLLIERLLDANAYRTLAFTSLPKNKKFFRLIDPPSVFFDPIVAALNPGTEPLVKNILLIDDSEVDLFVAVKTIENCGFAGQVSSVKSGAEALVHLARHANNADSLPDLIFLDVQMPDMNGFEFLEAFSLLEDTLNKTPSVVMLTSSSDVNDMKRAIASPLVRKFMNKPLTTGLVLETISQLQKKVQG